METSPSQQFQRPTRKAPESREKRMVTFQEFSKGLAHFAPRASLRRKFEKYSTFIVSRPLSRNKTLAASDGELNVAETERRGSSHSLNSNSSLPSMQSGHSRMGTVASWAVSFERLLEDPTGVLYFTAFLKSEVSAENILFWQACEKFRQIPANQKAELAREACSIYNGYLSSCASNAINIDDTAKTEQGDLEDPKPDMFNKAQQQIFKLMKFDSYTRFVRSQLYQNCMLANVEGRPLPDLGNGSRSPAFRKSGLVNSPSLGESNKRYEGTRLRVVSEDGQHRLSVWDVRCGGMEHMALPVRAAVVNETSPVSQQMKKAKVARSLPFDIEAGATWKRGSTESKEAQDKRCEKRGSWGAELSDHCASLSRRESQSSVKSTNSLELGSKAENGRSSPRNQEQERPGTGLAEKYCCVFLPDGTASLCPAQPGLSIRNMLAGLCEKRGFPLKDVVIYLQTKDKVSLQQPLFLDQDSAVLRDQQVSLELRVTFTLEVVFTGKAIGIKAKSSKTLMHTLSTVLQKHHLRPQEVIVTMSGSKEPLNPNMAVFSLANQRLLLDHAKGKDQSSLPKLTAQAPASQEQAEGPAEAEKSLTFTANRNRSGSKSKNPAIRKAYDMDGLIDLLSKVQCCRVDDQRGLLRKEDLVIPQFLMLLPDQCKKDMVGQEGGQGECPPPLPGEINRQSSKAPPTCPDHTPTTLSNKPTGGPLHSKVESKPEPGKGPDLLTSSPKSHAISSSTRTDSTRETMV